MQGISDLPGVLAGVDGSCSLASSEGPKFLHTYAKASSLVCEFTMCRECLTWESL